ncbi:hypothetical protein Ga0123461_2022 [Mariprofundus aestuarium]|uniref:Thioredoxin-like [2Fe-2S] ferredoxin n=1 Tax=Mariprofundus aestuarium TaxID=1921086 RepID=A0A2K8KZJ5_MARES|nr:hypothetical protein [Mariprofundus aestuarium]ATX80428.1 hypothetical protein Ga0123461_2022 [Mariprofundus aestuarium]
MCSNKKVIGVCYGPRCSDFGGRDMAEALREMGHEVENLDCQSLCPHAPAIRVNGRFVHRATIERVKEKL